MTRLPRRLRPFRAAQEAIIVIGNYSLEDEEKKWIKVGTGGRKNEKENQVGEYVVVADR